MEDITDNKECKYVKQLKRCNHGNVDAFEKLSNMNVFDQMRHMKSSSCIDDDSIEVHKMFQTIYIINFLHNMGVKELWNAC